MSFRRLRDPCVCFHTDRVVIASGILFHLVVPCCIDRLHVWLLSRWSAGKALSCVSAPIQLGQKWVSRDRQPPQTLLLHHKKVICSVRSYDWPQSVTPSLGGAAQDSPPPREVVLLAHSSSIFSSQCAYVLSVSCLNTKNQTQIMLVASSLFNQLFQNNSIWIRI